MKKNNSNKHKFFYCYSLISIILFLLFIISCGSASLNSNVPVDVYVGCKTNSGESAIYWKNGEIVSLSTTYWKNEGKKPLYLTERSGVESIFVSGNDIYAGGYYTKIDLSIARQGYSMDDYDVKVACYWKNGKLVSLNNSKYDSGVNAIFVSGNDVYTGGWNSNRKGVESGGYWKNGEWVGINNSKYGSGVNTIFVSDNDVYIGGWISNIKDVTFGCYWKNGKWVDISNSKYDSKVNALFLSENDVHVCGYSKNNLGSYTAFYWKNGKIISLLPSDSKYNSNGTSIFVSGNDVYVGGYSYNKPSSLLLSNSIAGYWKNGEWIALTPMNNKERSEVSSIFVYGKDVYAGGFCRVNGENVPGYWKNGKWVRLDAKGYYPTVTSIVVVPRPTGQ